MNISMHEYPITKRIIEIAEEFAQKNHADKIIQINLVVGDYSGYVASSVELYFAIIAEGSLAQNATLHIEHVVPKLMCQECGSMFERKPFSFQCPDCNGEGIPTETGKEFYIKSIEIE